MYANREELGWTIDMQRRRNYEVEDHNNNREMSWLETWNQDLRSNVRVKNTNIQVEQQQQLQQVNSLFIVRTRQHQ